MKRNPAIRIAGEDKIPVRRRNAVASGKEGERAFCVCVDYVVEKRVRLAAFLGGKVVERKKDGETEESFKARWKSFALSHRIPFVDMSE